VSETITPSLDFDDPVRVFGHLHVVRHDDDRAALGVELPQNAHHLFAAGLIERAGGLVRQDDVAAIDQGARDR
jgi:hypothetical protein